MTDRWKERVTEELGDVPFESLRSRVDGLEREPLYTEEDAVGPFESVPCVTEGDSPEERVGEQIPIDLSDHAAHAEEKTPAEELAAIVSGLFEAIAAADPSGPAGPAAKVEGAITLASHPDIFLTIAKFRAARILVFKVVHALGLRHGPITYHGTTSHESYRETEPWRNALRGTTQAFAGLAGGAELVTVEPFDSHENGGSAAARRLAINTPRILMEEAHVGRTFDPAAGSYYVETMTARIARGAWEIARDEARDEALGEAPEEQVRATEYDALPGTADDSPAAAAPPGAARSIAPSSPPFETPEGITIRPRYAEEDTANLDHLGGRPGFAP
ncbi:MAG: hypothetical protein HKN20_07725, partial [Gemmatimonadetes bacterium]|nr:hypothetical protein [Gemmatimonadota bacterium]